MNHVEASNLKYYEEMGKMKDITDTFLVNQDECDHDDETFFGASNLTKQARQSCRDLFITMSFRGKFLSWKNLSSIKDDEIEFNNIGPTYYPTDFGACCLFIPHVDFEKTNENLSYEETYLSLRADAQNGQINGLQLLLDAEQFNYAHIPASDGVGFKFALHCHTDKPMMQFSSQLISVGTETHINLIPVISRTTNDALTWLNPSERDCYADGEASLTYLPRSSGYLYSLNNCMIDDLITFILWKCRCIPAFTSKWIQEEYSELGFCFGEKLKCANDRMHKMATIYNREQNDLNTSLGEDQG